ncbi:hypothetical protein GYH30_011958 [Glycine max]|nr:hypothetical protein GYH30_011958 [Glycine max]
MGIPLLSFLFCKKVYWWGYHLVLLQLTKLSTSVVKGPS